MRTGPDPGCNHTCPLEQGGGVFRYARIERAGDEPPFDPRVVDIAILDMNYGMPNLGHDSLVNIIRAAACDFANDLRGTGLSIRVLSYDVRRSLMLPPPPGNRFLIYLGTGGPGHLDPRENTGGSEYSQGVEETDAWEAPLFKLFESILDNPQASLFGICHTFGLMCRWSGAAQVVLRGHDKGGKSAGVLENVLTEDAMEHPWFSKFAEKLEEPRRIRILDSRFFDLVPAAPQLPRGFVAIGFETRGPKGPRGDSVTMIEFARNAGESMPRMFAVNHHPEILDRRRQLALLYQKRASNHVTDEWFEERLKVLTTQYAEEDTERLVALTSYFTLVAPFRYQLSRVLAARAAELGQKLVLTNEAVFHSHYFEFTP